jgi:hypothetical protein
MEQVTGVRQNGHVMQFYSSLMHEFQTNYVNAQVMCSGDAFVSKVSHGSD